VFETHSFIGSSQPHLGKLEQLEVPIGEHLLPPISQNPNSQLEVKSSNQKQNKKNDHIAVTTNKKKHEGEAHASLNSDKMKHDGARSGPRRRNTMKQENDEEEDRCTSFFLSLL
jgi:hypothetical protein